MTAAMEQARYDTVERMWYLWSGGRAVVDGDGRVRLFLTAAAAYAWRDAQ